MKNSCWPRTEPCGTPYCTFLCFEVSPLALKILLLNQSTKLPWSITWHGNGIKKKISSVQAEQIF